MTFELEHQIEFPGELIRHLYFVEEGMASMTTTFLDGAQARQSVATSVRGRGQDFSSFSSGRVGSWNAGCRNVTVTQQTGCHYRQDPDRFTPG